MSTIPFVNYLRLDDEPTLVAQRCQSCGSRYFDRRNACASCFATTFEEVEVSRTGTVQAFSIVAVAGPGVPVPYVAAVVDCDGTLVRANIVNTPPDTDHVQLGMPVRLVTVDAGTDAAGTQAVSFGFEPVRQEGERNG